MNITGLAGIATTQGRAAAEALMTGSCTVKRPTGPRTFDKVTGKYSQPTSTVYEGKCRVKPRPVNSEQVEAGEQSLQLWAYIVSLPIAAIGIRAGDLVTDLQVPTDPDLDDRELVVREVDRGSNITARRLGCEDQDTGP